MNLLLQLMSLVGACAILIAFFGVQRGRWSSDHLGYLWANFVGASILAAVAVWDRRLGFVLLEVVWAVVSLWSIVSPHRRSHAGS